MSIIAASWAAVRPGTNVRFASRLYENVPGPRTPGIVFSIAFFRQKLPVQLVFTSTKSRWKFYAQVRRGSFQTALVKRRNTHDKQSLSAIPAEKRTSHQRVYE